MLIAQQFVVYLYSVFQEDCIPIDAITYTEFKFSLTYLPYYSGCDAD